MTYRVSVASYADNLERFAKQLPVRGKKGRLLQALLAGLPPTHTGPGPFGLPRELSASLAQQTKRKDQGKCLRREVCLEWAERLDDSQLREWSASDLLWEEIRSIEPYGEAEVFDVCIPGCSNFIANGIVAHNSGEIEQTSDVVMFIYRDEVYNPETERRNQADIIIAKQRNGPVDNVTLYFNQAQSRFQNLDTAFDPTTGEITFAAEDENEELPDNDAQD